MYNPYAMDVGQVLRRCDGNNPPQPQSQPLLPGLLNLNLNPRDDDLLILLLLLLLWMDGGREKNLPLLGALVYLLL